MGGNQSANSFRQCFGDLIKDCLWAQGTKMPFDHKKIAEMLLCYTLRKRIQNLSITGDCLLVLLIANLGSVP